MPELDSSWQPRGGVDVDALRCSEKVYTLLALFLASKSVHELVDGRTTWDPVFRATQEHEKPLMLHLFFECAVLIRILHDHYEVVHKKRPEMGRVGVLKTGTDPVDLSLRESCNKIIHAKTLNFDVGPDLLDENQYLNPVVHLRGDWQSSEWTAEVDIKTWACAAFELTAAL